MPSFTAAEWRVGIAFAAVAVAHHTNLGVGLAVMLVGYIVVYQLVKEAE